jgi:hypothetical protein
VNTLEPPQTSLNPASFWPYGLGILATALPFFLLRAGEKQIDWSAFLVLGSIVPLAALGISWIEGRTEGRSPRLLRFIQNSLALSFVIAALMLWVTGHPWVTLLVSLWQAGIVYCIHRFKKSAPVFSRSEAAWLLLFAVTAWSVSLRILWWDGFFDVLHASKTSLLVFFCIITLPPITLPPILLLAKASEVIRPKTRMIQSFISLTVLVVASLRLTEYPNNSHFHHWGAFIGPATLLQQGGWLLWDVPSQYGFLSALAIAFSPISNNPWVALYWTQASALFVTSAWIFFLLRDFSRGWLQWMLATLTTVALVFMLPGWPPFLEGPSVYPSVGAFRFLWIYGILAVLSLILKRGAKSPLLALLNLCWVLGFFWSSESAACCTVIALPAYLALVAGRCREIENRSTKRLFAIRWLSLPVLLLGGCFLLIDIYYRAYLGYRPDWVAFYDYAVGFRQYLQTEALNRNGATWQWLLIYCGVSGMVATRLHRGSLKNYRESALLLASWAATWSTASYIVGRGHDNVVITSMPIFVLCVLIVLKAIETEQCSRGRRLRAQTALALVTLLAFLSVELWVGFGNGAYAPSFFKSHLSPPGKVERIIESSNESVWSDHDLGELLEQAGVKRSDPIAFIDANPTVCNLLPPFFVGPDGMAARFPSSDGQLMISHRSWLPIEPCALNMPLSAERNDVYISRFTERNKSGGWLIRPTEVSDPIQVALIRSIGKSHPILKAIEHGRWTAVWYGTRHGAINEPGN